MSAMVSVSFGAAPVRMMGSPLEKIKRPMYLALLCSIKNVFAVGKSFLLNTALIQRSFLTRSPMSASVS